MAGYIDRTQSKNWVRNVVKMVKYFLLRYEVDSASDLEKYNAIANGHLFGVQ